MPDVTVTVKFSAAEHRTVVNELTIWRNKMQEHTKTLRASKAKNQLIQRGQALNAILKAL